MGRLLLGDVVFGVLLLELGDCLLLLGEASFQDEDALPVLFHCSLILCHYVF